MDRIMADLSPVADSVSNGPLGAAALMGYLKTAVLVIVIVLVGLFIAKALARLARTLIRRAKVDTAFSTLGWSKQLSSIGLDMKPSTVVAWLVKWFVIIATFSVVINVVGAPQLSSFLNDVLAYVPNVIIAVVVLIVGSLVANAVRTAVTRVVDTAQNVGNTALVVNVPYYAIMTVTVLAALNHLGIGGAMVDILFTGIVAALSLALGLAFGLGGKEHAARALDRMTRKQ